MNMSHYRIKTEYNEPDAYGNPVKKILYAHHNISSDCVTIYDNDGRIILSVDDDTMDNNLFDALQRLIAPFQHNSEFINGVESMTQEDRSKIFKTT